MSKPGEYIRSKSALIDPWSVPHFLFGMVMALGALVFEWPIGWSLLVTFVLAIGWEGIERTLRVRESRGNAMMDIILPVLSFAVTLVLLHRVVVSREHTQAFLIAAVLLYVYVNYSAWRARWERDRDFLN